MSWHLFLGSRRADERALNVPKHALSIFLMMIPLARAVLYAGDPVMKITQPVPEYVGKPTAEQKRKEIKAVKMKEGPRPVQVTLVVMIWLVSAFLSFERLINTQSKNGKPLSREYSIQPSDDSSREIKILRKVDITYCPVWNDNISKKDILFWVILVAIPVIFGPLLTGVIELFYYLKKKCSKDPYPDTPSLVRYWIIVMTSAAVVLGTYSTHLWLAEKYMKEYFGWNYFICLMVKYFLGSIDIMVIPLLVVIIDKQLRQGLGVICQARKKGTLSKANSTSTNL